MFNIVPYIFIVCPSFVGISFYNKLAKKKDRKIDIIKFCIYVLLSNIIASLFVMVFSGFNENLYEKVAGSTAFSCKYAFILIVVNILIGYIDFIKSNFFDFEIEESNGKKR